MAAEKNSPGAVQAVIFDLDGVLVSSIPVHVEAYKRTFAAEGREFTHEEYMRSGAGASREVLIRRVMGEIPEEKLSELMAAKERHARECVAERGLEPIPGAREFVEAVKGRGLKTAVATGSRSPELLLGGAGLADLFEVVVDRRDVEHPKPHPEIYALTTRRLGVSPTSCIALEDSPPGVEAALAAGLRVIALTTTEPADRLVAAHRVVASFGEIDLDDWLG